MSHTLIVALSVSNVNVCGMTKLHLHHVLSLFAAVLNFKGSIRFLVCFSCNCTGPTGTNSLDLKY